MGDKEDLIKCHCCGETIEKVDKRNYPDYLKIDKKWGYFSNKDLTKHSFIICEACYDKWTSSFAIPIVPKDVIEIFTFTADEDYDM